MDEVRRKFGARREDLNRLRQMAEEDDLVELFVNRDRATPRTINIERYSQYRAILTRLGVLGIAREQGIVFIPAVRYGWLIPDVTCEYVFIPKEAGHTQGLLSGVRLVPIESEWYEGCYSRGRGRADGGK